MLSRPSQQGFDVKSIMSLFKPSVILGGLSGGAINEFITSFFEGAQRSGQALPSTGSGSLPCRPSPRPLQWWLFSGSGPERKRYVPVPALFRTRPSVA